MTTPDGALGSGRLSTVGCRCYVADEREFRVSVRLHMLWCPNYRRRVIGGRMVYRLKRIIAEVVDEKGARPAECETMPDHVHLLVQVDPQFGIHLSRVSR